MPHLELAERRAAGPDVVQVVQEEEFHTNQFRHMAQQRHTTKCHRITQEVAVNS